MTILVDRKTVRALLNWPDVIEAVRGAYLAAAAGDTVPPASSHVPLTAGAMHLKAGGTTRPALVSVKANLRPDAAAAAGLVLLYDTASWTVRAIIDSADLTAWRTAAAAVVGARALGAAPGTTVAILGAGPLAEATLSAVRYELGVREVHVWSRSRERAGALGPAEVIQVHDTPGAATQDADLVITCTPSRKPLISADDVRADAMICAMGADSPGKRELAADVLAGAAIVTDNLTGAREAGELAGLSAAAPGAIEEIGDLLAGRRSLPRADGRRVFDSVGVAHVDTAMAALIAGAAAAAGLGVNWEPAAL